MSEPRASKLRGSRGGNLKIPSFSYRGGAREGAGRKPRHRKTSEFLRLGIYELRRIGALSKGVHFTARVGECQDFLHARVMDNQLALDYLGNAYRVAITRTPCALGGTRPWFACPRCNKRVAVLHFGRSDAGCVQCLGLRYPSQSEGWFDRDYRQEERLKRRLSGSYGRPKGMHTMTYERHLQSLFKISERREWAMEALERYF